MTISCVFPSWTGYFLCDYKHHQVVGGGIKLDEQVVGCEAKIIVVGHAVTHQGRTGPVLRAAVPVLALWQSSQCNDVWTRRPVVVDEQDRRLRQRQVLVTLPSGR